MYKHSNVLGSAGYLLNVPGLELRKAIDSVQKHPELREQLVTVLAQELGGPLSFQLMTSSPIPDIMDKFRDLNGFANEVVAELLQTTAQ